MERKTKWGKKMFASHNRLLIDIKKNYILYFMIIPVVAYYVIFSYIPMAGVQLAFKKYSTKLGIWGSPFIGVDNFRRFFNGYNFWGLIKNTLGISTYSLVVGFPAAIIFALMLNYVRNKKLKKSVQMISYVPHFISLVVMCGMIKIFLDVDTGVINKLRSLFGGESISFLSVPQYFKTIYVLSGIWQSVGWSSIIYISALSGVNYEMHEAAIVDGASILQRMRFIDIPSIKSTIMMLFILQMGKLMNLGFEKIYLLQNNLNFSSSDVIATYVYRIGILQGDYGYSTAVGLFNSVINLFLLIVTNFLSKKATEESLF